MSYVDKILIIINSTIRRLFPRYVQAADTLTLQSLTHCFAITNSLSCDLSSCFMDAVPWGNAGICISFGGIILLLQIYLLLLHHYL